MAAFNVSHNKSCFVRKMAHWPKTSTFLIYQLIVIFSLLCSMSQSGTVKDDLKKLGEKAYRPTINVEVH